MKHIDPKKRTYLHPLPVRIWHWLNALCFILLIITGLAIRYGVLIGFELAFHLHVWIGAIAILNWFLWFLFYMTTSHGQNYYGDIKFKDFYNRLMKQVDYYTRGIFFHEEKPHEVKPFNKFNPMQKITYQYFMFFIIPLMFITGVALWQVAPLYSIITFVGGVKVMHVVHYLLFCIFVFFIPVHAYMGFLGKRPLDHYKEMFDGYERD